MFKCRFYRFLIRLIPLKIVQSFVIQHHFERCPRCQLLLAQPEEVKSLLLQPEAFVLSEQWLEKVVARARIEDKSRPGSRVFLGRSLGWKTMVVASIFVLLLIGYFVFQRLSLSPGNTEKAGEVVFGLEHLRVRGKPADPVIYRPFGSKLIFIWGQSHNLQENK